MGCIRYKMEPGHFSRVIKGGNGLGERMSRIKWPRFLFLGVSGEVVVRFSVVSN